MRNSTRILAAGVAATAMLAAGAYAFAQHGPGFGPGMMRGMGSGPMGDHGQMKGPMGGRMGGAFAGLTARLDAIKAEIGIKPEQTAAWDAYAKTVNDTAAEQRKHVQQIDPARVRAMQPDERQQHFTAMQARRQGAQQTVRSAAETLLSQLDDTQKAKASQTLPGIATAGHGMQFGMGRRSHR